MSAPDSLGTRRIAAGGPVRNGGREPEAGGGMQGKAEAKPRTSFRSVRGASIP